MTALVRVVVDRDLCMSSRTCVDLAPENFRIGDDHVSVPIEEVVPDSEEVQDAVYSCPVQAIRAEPLEERADSRH